MKNFFVTYKNPLTVVLVLIIAGGIFTYGKIQSSLFPEITFPKIKIIADAGLQPVDKMMVTVTKPLENAIKQVPDLQMIRSTTSKGSCEISAYMTWGSAIDLSLQRIQARINDIQSQLPPEVQITVEKMNPSILPVMGYTIESRDKSPIEMKMLANYTIKPFLSQVNGVSDVRVIGGKTKEYWIQLDIQKMGSLGITPELVANAMAQTNFVKSNGYVSDYRYLYLTITDATVHALDDLKQVVVSNDGKRIITIQDIATVQINESVEFTKVNANGKAGVLIAVIKQPNANLLTLSEAMKRKVEALRKTLPKGVTIKPYYIQADFVSDSIRSVSDSLWLGLGLAIIVSVLFLRSWKASATILVTIPITLFLTLIVLYAIGYTFNIMTLGALAAAIGLIIDDAIVVMEQIQRTHEEHPEEATTNLLQKAIRYLFPAMLGSSISTIVIFIPFIMMSGVAGAYFKVLTDTMIITLLCSFFVTWIGLPVVYLRLGGNTKKDTGKFEGNEVKQQGWISFFIHRPWISFCFAGVLLVAVVLVLPRLQTGFLPEMDEGSIVLDYTSPPGTSLQETDRMLRQVEQIIQQTPEVLAYSRRTGTQMGFFITEPNTGDYLIQLKKNRRRSTDEVINAIRLQIEGSQPALRVDFGQVIGDMLGDLMTSVQPVEVKIFGNDQHQLQQFSKQLADLVSTVPGTADVFDGIIMAGPSVSVVPNYAKLAQLGITPANLQMQLQASIEGNVVGSILEKEQLSTIRMTYPNNKGRSISDIGKLNIFLPTGKRYPLSMLATINIKSGDAEIQRENLQSVGVVTARLENRDLGAVVKEIQQKVSHTLALPSGYHIEYGGAYADQQQSFKELLMILITASLLVFGVILFLFREFKVALAIVVIAAFGISGSYLALFLTNTPLNVGSYTGLIMIVGIIGENAIFTFLQFREAIKTRTAEEAIIYAISTRLRPKLMTAIGAIMALLPLALGIGAGAQLHQPLAIAVIGGFIIALPLLLIVLPSVLKILYKRN
ncbi:efflux RND transporter permease subunit [Olivibacter sp. CPCC 100613]|uniref:efflux RND transporter permease subunit n=1 Tax=Olivibacter sp. CPCC 100613 TaxID=3079931 RepID=UPI002FFD0502